MISNVNLISRLVFKSSMISHEVWQRIRSYAIDDLILIDEQIVASNNRGEYTIWSYYWLAIFMEPQ